MSYNSPKKVILFWLLTISIIIAIWLLWLGVDSYFLTQNPLVNISQNRAITMAILAIILLFFLLIGLVLATLLGNKRYSKYFSIFSAILLLALLIVRSISR